MKELGGKTGVLVGLNLPSVGGGTEAVVQSLHGAIVWVRGETFKAESETADLWQPKWNENQTALAAAQHTQDRDTGPLEGAEAESWSLRIVEQHQGEGAVDQVLIGTEASPPGQPQEQNPKDNPHAEVEIKPQLKPRAVWLRKKTQNLSTSCTSYRLNPHDQLGRLCVYGIYKRRLRALTHTKKHTSSDRCGHWRQEYTGVGPD